MKKKLHYAKIGVLGLILLGSLAAASCSAQTTAMQEEAAKESSSYPVPAEKAQLWEGLKNKARNDYDVCQEHCGYEQECLNRCESAYEARLEREYKMLMEQ